MNNKKNNNKEKNSKIVNAENINGKIHIHKFSIYEIGLVKTMITDDDRSYWYYTADGEKWTRLDKARNLIAAKIWALRNILEGGQEIKTIVKNKNTSIANKILNNKKTDQLISICNP